jgi:hypothetical protein
MPPASNLFVKVAIIGFLVVALLIAGLALGPEALAGVGQYGRHG